MTGDPKAFSSLQARCALAGVVLAAIRNDSERWAYVVTHGAYTRELESLEAVEAWLVEHSDQLAEVHR